jgi:hypothetical protein
MLISQKIQMYSFEKVLIGFNAAHCIRSRQGRGDMDGEQGSGLMQKKHTPVVLGTIYLNLLTVIKCGVAGTVRCTVSTVQYSLSSPPGIPALCTWPRNET